MYNFNLIKNYDTFFHIKYKNLVLLKLYNNLKLGYNVKLYYIKSIKLNVFNNSSYDKTFGYSP